MTAPNLSHNHTYFFRDTKALHADHLLHALEKHSVQAVVRLNPPHSRSAVSTMAGMPAADLSFDGPVPTAHIAHSFLTLVECLPGAAALHCPAGPADSGAGALIALYMMKDFGFTARAAMGWLRLTRPGWVAGPQRRFLCDQEAAMRRAAEEFRRRGPAHRRTVSLRPADSAAAGVARLIEAVMRGRQAPARGQSDPAVAEGLGSPPRPPSAPGAVRVAGGGWASSPGLRAYVRGSVSESPGGRAGGKGRAAGSPGPAREPTGRHHDGPGRRRRGPAGCSRAGAWGVLRPRWGWGGRPLQGGGGCLGRSRRRG